jgi:hypothetical protein
LPAPFSEAERLWLDGFAAAHEIGMFAELVHSGGELYRGIVAIATDLRLERRRRGATSTSSGSSSRQLTAGDDR